MRLRSKSTGAWLVHPDLRSRLVEEAEAEDTSLADLVLRILCKHFNVPYESKLTRQRKSPPKADSDVLLFGMPPALVRAVSLAYPVRKLDGIRYVLCAHYGLRVPPKVKQTRARRRSS